MENKDCLSELRQQLDILKNSGQDSVSIEALEKFISAYQIKGAKISTQDIQFRLAHYDAEVKSNLEAYKATVQHDIEMFKSVIDSGKEALNATLLINGGATVALLGFLSSVVSKTESKPLALALTFPLCFFGVGILCGALGFGIRYCAQFFYAKKIRWLGHICNGLSSLLAAFSFGSFGYGLFLAYKAFQTYFTV